MKACFSDEDIDAYLFKKMSEEEARAFEEHYFNCPRCFQEVAARDELVRVIKSRGPEIFSETVPAFVPKPSRTRRVFEFFTPRQWAFVSLTVIALLVILFAGLPRFRPEPPHFVLDGEDILRGGSLTLISPVIDIKGAPTSFEWRSFEGAAEYKVSLYDGKTLLWTSVTKDSRMIIPEDIKAKLSSGQNYSWQVKAFSPEGRLISVSSRVHFEIRPASK
jgi:hypothetical protein